MGIRHKRGIAVFADGRDASLYSENKASDAVASADPGRLHAVFSRSHLFSSPAVSPALS